MDPELNDLLRENLEITKRNNEILEKQWKAYKWGRFFKIFYWIIIIGIALGAYYYIQPIIDAFLAAFGTAGDGIGSIFGKLKEVQKIGSSLPEMLGGMTN